MWTDLHKIPEGPYNMLQVPKKSEKISYFIYLYSAGQMFLTFISEFFPSLPGGEG